MRLFLTQIFMRIQKINPFFVQKRHQGTAECTVLDIDQFPRLFIDGGKLLRGGHSGDITLFIFCMYHIL